MADTAAKEATGWRLVRNARGRNCQADTSLTAPTTVVKVPVSILKTKLGAQTEELWMNSWQQDKRARDLFRIADQPTKDILKLSTKHERIPSHETEN
jgi:hypothetical protein